MIPEYEEFIFNGDGEERYKIQLGRATWDDEHDDDRYSFAFMWQDKLGRFTGRTRAEIPIEALEPLLEFAREHGYVS